MQFPYLEKVRSSGATGLLPYLPLLLAHDNDATEIEGLLDTGATVNVLPYDVGLRVGAVWENQQMPVHLTGNLARLEARVLILSALVGQFEPVRLAFAWTQANNIPVILGQVNFFSEFDICFYRTQAVFELRPVVKS